VGDGGGNASINSTTCCCSSWSAGVGRVHTSAKYGTLPRLFRKWRAKIEFLLEASSRTRVASALNFLASSAEIRGGPKMYRMI